MGGTLGGARVYALPGSVGNMVSAWVRLGGGVRVLFGVPIAAKMSDNFRIESIFWAPKQAKVADSVGLVRVLARSLAV